MHAYTHTPTHTCIHVCMRTDSFQTDPCICVHPYVCICPSDRSIFWYMYSSIYRCMCSLCLSLSLSLSFSLSLSPPSPPSPIPAPGSLIAHFPIAPSGNTLFCSYQSNLVVPPRRRISSCCCFNARASDSFTCSCNRARSTSSAWTHIHARHTHNDTADHAIRSQRSAQLRRHARALH